LKKIASIQGDFISRLKFFFNEKTLASKVFIQKMALLLLLLQQNYTRASFANIRFLKKNFSLEKEFASTSQDNPYFLLRREGSVSIFMWNFNLILNLNFKMI
jgi:hypothetical protein